MLFNFSPNFGRMANKFLKIMMNRKVWPVLIIILLFSGIFWAFTGRGAAEVNINSNDDKYVKQQKLLTAIGSILEERHYSPKLIDDEFSKSVFKKYLEDL